jgi:hypothetical protein
MWCSSCLFVHGLSSLSNKLICDKCGAQERRAERKNAAITPTSGKLSSRFLLPLVLRWTLRKDTFSLSCGLSPFSCGEAGAQDRRDHPPLSSPSCLAVDFAKRHLLHAHTHTLVTWFVTHTHTHTYPPLHSLGSIECVVSHVSTTCRNVLLECVLSHVATTCRKVFDPS